MPFLQFLLQLFCDLKGDFLYNLYLFIYIFLCNNWNNIQFADFCCYPSYLLFLFFCSSFLISFPLFFLFVVLLYFPLPNLVIGFLVKYVITFKLVTFSIWIIFIYYNYNFICLWFFYWKLASFSSVGFFLFAKNLSAFLLQHLGCYWHFYDFPF